MTIEIGKSYIFVNNDYTFECVKIRECDFSGVLYPMDSKGRLFDPKSLRAA